MLRGQEGYKKRLELAIRTPGCPLKDEVVSDVRNIWRYMEKCYIQDYPDQCPKQPYIPMKTLKLIENTSQSRQSHGVVGGCQSQTHPQIQQIEKWGDIWIKT